MPYRAIPGPDCAMPRGGYGVPRYRACNRPTDTWKGLKMAHFIEVTCGEGRKTLINVNGIEAVYIQLDGPDETLNGTLISLSNGESILKVQESYQEIKSRLMPGK